MVNKEPLIKTDGTWDMSPEALAFHNAQIAEYKIKDAAGTLTSIPPENAIKFLEKKLAEFKL